jgi:hypothetical protein
MSPILLLGLGYLAWQVLKQIEDGMQRELASVAGIDAVAAWELQLKAHWDAWFALRRVIAEYMLRKNEAREQRNFCRRKDPQGRAQEIRELNRLLGMLSRKLDEAYAKKAQIAAYLEAYDPDRFSRREEEAKARTRGRVRWVPLKNWLRRRFRK